MTASRFGPGSGAGFGGGDASSGRSTGAAIGVATGEAAGNVTVVPADAMPADADGGDAVRVRAGAVGAARTTTRATREVAAPRVWLILSRTSVERWKGADAPVRGDRDP